MLQNNFSVKGLENITKLQGVNFDWISTGQPEVGLIAQEVEKIYPELVVTNSSTGMKAVKYGNLVGPLIESTKELYNMCVMTQKQMDELQKYIDKNDNKVTDLQKRIESLEKENKKLHRDI